MTTDATRPEDAPQSGEPQSQSQPVTETEAIATDLQKEPESSAAPEPPEMADAPETPVGDTAPASPVSTESTDTPPAADTGDGVSGDGVSGDGVSGDGDQADANQSDGATSEGASSEPAASAQGSETSESVVAATMAIVEQVGGEGAGGEPTGDEQAIIDEAAAAQGESPTAAASDSDAVKPEGAKIQMQGAEDAAPVPSTGDTTPPPSNEKVEIPQDEDLDAGLEAELEAALAGEQTSKPADAAPEAAGDASEASPAELTMGQRVKGTISSVTGDAIVVDLGVRTAGIIPARQFAKQTPEVGQQVDVVVDSINEEEGTAACSLPGGSRKPTGNWDGVAVGQVVDAVVKKTNKGGLEVMVGGLRGFMPASQVDLGFVSDLEQFVDKKLTTKILEVNPQRRKLVVSRRALLAEERKEKEGELFEQLEKGKTITGTVKSIKDFGAFVDLGGADGLLHIGQISWSRINHPSDVLEVGQEVEVQILEVDIEKKKISLSMRQLQANPWTLAEQNYPVGSPVNGTVSRVADFGAFVKLEPGVEGLIHISQLDHKRVRAVGDVVQEGQEVEAKVLEVDTGKRRISLSLKAMSAPAAEDMDMMEEPAQEERRRRRKSRGDLRGGTGGSGGGGLFGDPKDFS